MTIDVIWYQGQRGHWDHGMLMSVFEKHPTIFKQWNENYSDAPIDEKVIVIVAGKPDVVPLYGFLNKIQKAVVILTSEEDAYFDWKNAIPERHDIWTQYYSPSTKSEIKTRLLIGPPSRIKDYKINSHLPKKYLWSFVGQVQNPFRQACVDVLKTLDNGYLRIVDGFGGEGEGGVEYQEYLDIMCQSKYVICPAGSMCVDSFRVYEAIECGAIPISDMRAPRDKVGFNYWNEVYADQNEKLWFPLTESIAIPDWENALRYFINYDAVDVYDVRKSWTYYKKNFENKLLHEANTH